MNEIRPIETEYAGHRFRSRIEARWATFFDHVQLPWQYEVQGFHTEAGPYLPDFWLPSLSSWFEVKSDSGTADDRVEALSAEQKVYVAFGLPRAADPLNSPFRGDGYIELFWQGWDGDYAFCICPQCGRVGIEHQGRQGRVCGHPGVEEEGGPGPLHPLVVSGYQVATRARFEHGERG